MTRKHFEALADALAAARLWPTVVSAGYYMEQWRADVRAVAGVCQAFNPDFNQARFFERAGYDEE